MKLFDFPKVRIEKKIRLIELFGGIGSQAMALRNIGADFEHYRLVEFDKYCINSYNSIHHTNFETIDIKNVHGADLGIVEKDRFTYLLTYSFPCTDLSVAGKMLGMSRKEWEEGKATRSGLLWEVERILTELPKEQLPDILLMENVPQVHAEKNREDFERWLSFLRGKGYYSFWKDLNARDFGIPQNRERCFCVSVLSEDFVEYEFPKEIPLGTVMKDYLEETVEEKYYINNEKADKLIRELIDKKQEPTLCQVSKVKRLGNLYGENKGTGFAGNVWDKNNLCPTIMTMQGGGREPMIIDDVEAKKYRIRKLTPRECWRLMAFSDEDFDKAEKVVSNTQIYKQAGNSICVCVLMAIFSQMNIKGVKPWTEVHNEKK